MLNFSDYKKLYTNIQNSSTDGELRKYNSDIIMEYSWDRDSQSKTAYLYDYFHDSERDKTVGLNPDKDELKIPVKIKFITHAYNTDDSEQVSYHIQFQPSYKCNVPYFYEEYERKYHAQFPIGLYVDIPDTNKVYHRWLIIENADRYCLSFNKFSVLPTNYHLYWIEDDGKHRYERDMWVVENSRNSYNAGTYTDRIFTKVENQNLIRCPLNQITQNLHYDQRLIVSAPIPLPLAWKISKIENTIPLGINRITLAQDNFNQDTDFIDLETGAMYADYYLSQVPPSKEKPEIAESYYGVIQAASYNIRINGSYKTLQVEWFNSEGEKADFQAISWSYMIDGNDAKDLIETRVTDNNNAIQLRFIGDYSYLTKILTVTCTDSSGQLTAVRNFEIKSI